MIIELNKHVQLIRPEGKSVFPYCNSVFIKGDPSILIDAGSGGRAYRDIKEPVDILLLSHNHFDHINGVSFFPDAQVWASREEAPGYEDAAVYASYNGYQHWEKLMGQPRYRRLGQIAVMPNDIPVSPGFVPVQLGGLIDDGHSWDTGYEHIIALHTPGHSHGHCSFWLENSNILFSGDIDLSPYGPWYGAENSSFDQFETSVRRLELMDPSVLITSHRRPFTRGKDNITKLLREYIDIGLQKEHNILNYMKVSRAFMDIADQPFVSTYPTRTEYTQFWSRMMLLKHLQRLERRGLITEFDDGQWRRI